MTSLDVDKCLGVGVPKQSPACRRRRGVISLVRRGKHFFRLSMFLFRFPSRFHLYIPVSVTVAPVSRYCGLYLAVLGTV
jgi:hypothetical protein